MTIVYENNSYKVVLDKSPYVHDGEPMNWLVINKHYETVEATTSALPNAILLCDRFSELIQSTLGTEERSLN